MISDSSGLNAYVDDTRLSASVEPEDIASEPITVTEYDSSLQTSQDELAAVQLSGYQTLTNIKSTAFLVQRNECIRNGKPGETGQSNFAVFNKVNVDSTYSELPNLEYSELVSDCMSIQ